MGIFSVTMAMAAFVSALRNFGVATYIIQAEKLSVDDVRTAYGMLIVFSWVIGGGLFLFKGLIADLAGIPELEQVMTVIVLAYLVTPFGTVANGLFIREMRFDILFKINFIASTVGIGVNIVLAYYGFSYMALAWGFLATNILISILSITYKPTYLKHLPNLKNWRKLIGFGGLMTITTMIATINTDGIRFILGSVLGPASLAFFERSLQIPDQARQAINIPAGKVLLASFSEKKRQKENVGTLYLQNIDFFCILLWPPFLVFAILAEPMIVVIFGENWLFAGTIAPFLVFSTAIMVCAPSIYQIAVANNKIKELFYMQVFVAIFNIIITYYSAMISMEMFVYSRSLVALATIFLSFRILQSIFKVEYLKIFIIYIRAIFVSLISAIPAILYHISSDKIGIVELGIITGLSFLFWGFSIFIIRHAIYFEIIEAIKKLKTA